MIDLFSPTALLIHIASLLAVIGMLMRDQLRLRALILGGACFEVLYYWLHPATPLWPSIFWATLISIVNTVVMVRIWQDRRLRRMAEEEREIYLHLAGLEPGQFRRLHRLGQRHESTETAQLTTEGVVPDRLWFIHRGDVCVEKSGRMIHVRPPCFIGEVSLLLGGGATATVHLPGGGIWFSWSRADLAKLFRKEPEVRTAFERILGRDMAGKVARG